MSLEELGAILGFVAFVGLAVLIFLTFQQARQLRRLRDWAGRAPERAAAIAARTGEGTEPAAAEEEPPDVPEERGPSAFQRFRERSRESYQGIDRRMPVDPRIVAGGFAAIVLGIAIATGAFGLVGGESTSSSTAAGDGGSGSVGSGQSQSPTEPKPPKVAVLNATAPPTGGPAVAGIADRISADVEAAGFRVGPVGNAPSTPASVVMFKADAGDDASEVASALEPVLGQSEVVAMTPAVEAEAGGTDVALVIGQDDSSI